MNSWFSSLERTVGSPSHRQNHQQAIQAVISKRCKNQLNVLYPVTGKYSACKTATITVVSSHIIKQGDEKER